MAYQKLQTTAALSVLSTYNANIPTYNVVESGTCTIPLPSELEEGGALPYMIEFKSTSLRAGKKMATQMYTKNLASGLSPAAKVFVLSLTKEQNDKGTFAVFDVAVDRNSTGDEQAEALKWFKLLGSGAAKVHEEGDDLPPL